jgi:hypothetical protein
MKIQHIILGTCEHVLVVDGVRGPLSHGDLAWHPAGVVAIMDKNYSYAVPADAKGKVFVLAPEADVERIEDLACEAKNEAWQHFTEVADACVQVKLARYGVAPEEAK